MSSSIGGDTDHVGTHSKKDGSEKQPIGGVMLDRSFEDVSKEKQLEIEQIKKEHIHEI